MTMILWILTLIVYVCFVMGGLISDYSTRALRAGGKTRALIFSAFAIGVIYAGSYLAFKIGFGISEVGHQEMDTVRVVATCIRT